MRIYINGKETEIAGGLSVAELIAERGFTPGTVVVEHNQMIPPKEKWSQILLAADDKLEIIRIIGGG